MARRLRIEYPGARHHVINRGNYRRNLFDTVGAAEAFLRVLFEGATKFGWQVNGYVLMRNHFHLAVETPEPNLGEGMHWLQTTMSVRFNRWRKEHGHLFQGRYHALVIEDAAALARVVDYIHLNPVRAKIVLPGQVVAYRWSSLAALRRGPRAKNLVCADWLRQRGGWADDAEGLGLYIQHLEALAQDERRQEREGVTGLGRGWAIGTRGWMQTLAKRHASLGLAVGLPKDQRDALRESQWQASLGEELTRAGRRADELKTVPLKQEWKLALAETLRAKTGASISWLAKNLYLGGAATLRGYMHLRKEVNRKTD